MSEHVLKFRWSVGFTLFDDFPVSLLISPGVPCCLVYLGLFEAFSFHRDMESVKVLGLLYLQIPQDFDEVVHIVAVHGAEVPEAKSLPNRLL